MTTTETTYPEHEKLRAVSDLSQAIGEFIEASEMRGLHLCEVATTIECHFVSWETRDGAPLRRCVNGVLVDHEGDEIGDCSDCDGTGEVERTEPRYYPTGRTITSLLAEHFDIDLNVIEAEKRAMLESLRG